MPIVTIMLQTQKSSRNYWISGCSNYENKLVSKLKGKHIYKSVKSKVVIDLIKHIQTNPLI